MAREVVVYIHGVTPKGQYSHQWQYAALHEALRKRIGEGFPEDFCGVEWGWAAPDSPARSHQLLDAAETRLGARAISAVGDASDFTLNPLRIAVNKFRGLMIYGLSDMFYYVSEDGKSAVRYAAAAAIVKYLKPMLADPQAQISLTLLGHSAGSIVAYDLLFYLFYKERKIQSFIDASKVKAPASDAGTPADMNAPVKLETLGDLQRLKAMAQLGQLRVRRLFTFGSPITPLAFRSDAVLSILARPDDGPKPNRLTAENYGLTINPESFGALHGPRWVNFWDKDDPIAWPVEPLMLQTPDVVKDAYVDVSDDITNAHGEYWGNEDFQKMVAEAW